VLACPARGPMANTPHITAMAHFVGIFQTP
jgi:hypothetical protein